jgi:DNA-binding response OmpR family regulator
MTTLLRAVPPSAQAARIAAGGRLSTKSLHDDEIRAIADTVYRDDNPMRFEGVRQAVLLFEHAGYVIVPSTLALEPPVPQRTVVGRLVVDREFRSARLGGRELDLKPREFDLLDVLASHPRRVFTRLQLLDLAWPRDFLGDEKTVDVHISRLRRALGETSSAPSVIAAVHGVGYKFVPDDDRCCAG